MSRATSPRTRDEHLFGDGPKRILALDGGGIRGILTLGILKHVEDELRERSGGDPEFRLADYFDLIGGTSTGAIIAAGLATGMSVDELLHLYRKMGASIFERPFWRVGLLAPKFGSGALRDTLEDAFGSMAVGDERIRTGLMVMAKRLDTGSPWPIHNNPKSRYFDPSTRGSSAVPNKDFPLTRVVRASTAAPHYFEPETIRITDEVEGAFVDGGTSPHNNPALLLFLLATLSGYAYEWPTGPERLLLLSVGTGHGETAVPARTLTEMKAAGLAVRALTALMDDCNWLVQTLLQSLSHSPTPWTIDRELGDLGEDLLGGRAMLHYLRYDARLEPDWLEEHLGVEVSAGDAKALQGMDQPGNLQRLEEIGDEAGAYWVEAGHFPEAFDVR